MGPPAKTPCPYCYQRECSSDDHIFLEAIGGKRTIRACKPCNDLFGHSFEGSAVANFFFPLLVTLRMAGVPVLDTGAKWRRAHVTEDGLVYNAVLDAGGYKLESTNVVVTRDDENPKIFRPILGDDRVGRKHLRQFLDSGRFRLESMAERRLVDPREFNHDWGFNPDMKLTALKMAFAVANVAFPEELPGFAQPRAELIGADLSAHPPSVAGDLRDHPSLDALRDPLCHVIYVEQIGECIHAFVQFFGSVQFCVVLKSRASSLQTRGFIGRLDPVTGAESFSEVPALVLPPFRDCVVDAMVPIRKLNTAAVKRGSKVAEMIRLNEVRVDGVVVRSGKPYWVTSWTGDLSKKPQSSHSAD